MKEVAFPVTPGNILSLFFGFLAAGVLFFAVPFILIWPVTVPEINILHPLVGIFLLVLGAVLHEFLHVLGWMIFAGINLNNVEFGIKSGGLAAYVNCTEPLKMSAYRFGVMLPGLLLGVIPSLIGLISGSGGFLLYGLIMFASAGADFAVLWKSRSFNSDSYVVDHPEGIGFMVTNSEAEAKEFTEKEFTEKKFAENAGKIKNKGGGNIWGFIKLCATSLLIMELIALGLYIIGYFCGKAIYILFK